MNRGGRNAAIAAATPFAGYVTVAGGAKLYAARHAIGALGPKAYEGAQAVRVFYELNKLKYGKLIAGLIAGEGFLKGISGDAPNPGSMGPSRDDLLGLPGQLALPAQGIGYGIQALYD